MNDKTDSSSKQRVRLTADIWDNGEDHHPPGIIARKGDIVIVRRMRIIEVAHEGVENNAFVVTSSEFEPISANETLDHSELLKKLTEAEQLLQAWADPLPPNGDLYWVQVDKARKYFKHRGAKETDGKRILTNIARRAAALLPDRSSGGDGPELEINLRSEKAKDNVVLTCEGCGTTAELPRIGQEANFVSIIPANGWQLYPKHLCSTCSALNGTGDR